MDETQTKAFAEELLALLLKYGVTLEDFCRAVIIILAEQRKGRG